MNETMFVDKFYEMDPQFEDLISEGTQLQNGMIVLIEDSMLRADLDRTQDDKYYRERARENNRWCTVTELTFRQRWEYDEYGKVLGELTPLVSFVAVYGDGVKKKRSLDNSYAWIVKLESISDAE